MIKDSVILTFSKGIRGVLMLVFNMILARCFTESLYGTYKQVNLIITLATSICIIGIPTTISYYYSSYKKRDREYLVGNTIIILAIIGFFSSLFLGVFRQQIAVIFNNNEILNYVNILIVYLFIMVLSSFLENLYIASENAMLLGKIYIGYTFINFSVIIFLVLKGNGLYWILLFTVLIEILRTVIMVICIKRKEALKFKYNYKLIKGQIIFSIPLGVVAIIQNLNMYVDNIFISNKYSPEQYAAYANAATDIPFVGIITVSVAAVTLPKMSKIYNETNSFEDVKKIWSKSIVQTAIILFPIFWICLLFASGYIELIFSSKYVADSTPIFIIYLIRFPLLCTVYGNILIVLNNRKYIMKNSIIAIVLNVILNFLFLQIWGMKGPAISSVLVYFLTVALLLRKISKITNTKLKYLIDYKEIAKVFIIPGIICAPIYLFSIFINISEPLKLIVFGTIIFVISLIVYIKFDLINIKKIGFKGSIS